jgi:hypothetical protein
MVAALPTLLRSSTVVSRLLIINEARVVVSVGEW